MSDPLLLNDSPLSSRHVLDLDLAEQVVIWAVRHHASRAPENSMTDGFARIFGSEMGLVAAAGVEAVMGTVERHGHEGMAPGGSMTPRLTPLEEELLAILGCLQRDRAITAVSRASNVVARDGVQRLIDGLTTVAASLMSRNLILTDEGDLPEDLPVPANDMELAASTETTPFSERARPATAPETRVHGLTYHEGLIVYGIRFWVGNVQAGNAGLEGIQRALSAVGLSEVADTLNGFLRITGLTARRPVAVNCPRCYSLTPDEARMLHGIANCQRGDLMIGFEMLSTWLPPTSVRISLDLLRSAAGTLSGAGITLPVRDWLFPELDEGATSWHQVGLVGPETLN